MGVGPNYVLNKGLVATGSTAYKFGELVVSSGDGTKCARATSAGAKCVGVCEEDIDAVKVTTGKAVINIALMGIARVLVGSAIAVGDRLTNDTTARAVPVAAAVGTKESFGVALTANSTVGGYVDVLITPFASVNTAVS